MAPSLSQFMYRWLRLPIRWAVCALVMLVIVLPSSVSPSSVSLGQSCGHYVRTRLDRERQQQFANRVSGFRDASEEALAQTAQQGLVQVYRLPVDSNSAEESKKPCDGPGCRSTQWPPAASVATVIPSGSRVMPLAILSSTEFHSKHAASTLLLADKAVAIAMAYPLFRPPQ